MKDCQNLFLRYSAEEAEQFSFTSGFPRHHLTLHPVFSWVWGNTSGAGTVSLVSISRRQLRTSIYVALATGWRDAIMQNFQSTRPNMKPKQSKAAPRIMLDKSPSLAALHFSFLDYIMKKQTMNLSVNQ